MNDYIKNHNFGYGTCEQGNSDSTIIKLKLRNIKDLKCYLKDLISSQDENAKVINNKVKKKDFSDIKIQIKKQKIHF